MYFGQKITLQGYVEDVLIWGEFSAAWHIVGILKLIIIMTLIVVAVITDSVLFWVDVPGAHVAFLSELDRDPTSNLKVSIVCC